MTDDVPSLKWNASDAVLAVELHEETAKRMVQLEAIISDTSLNVISRTKAKIELALLKNGDGQNISLERENTATTEGSGASQTAEKSVKSNEDRIKALQIQQEAKLRSDEARLRLAEAEAAMIKAEKEYEKQKKSKKKSRKKASRGSQSVASGAGTGLSEQMEDAEYKKATAKAKAAKKKLSKAQKRVEEERRLFEEAKVVEESQVVEEMEVLEKVAKNGGDDKRVWCFRRGSWINAGEVGSNKNLYGKHAEEPNTGVSKSIVRAASTPFSLSMVGGARMDVDKDAKNGGTGGDIFMKDLDIKYSMHEEEEQLLKETTSLRDELAAMKSEIMGVLPQYSSAEGGGEKEMDEDAAHSTKLSEQNATLQAMVNELQAANERRQDKIKSLEDHLEASGATQQYWKEKSARLSDELSDMQQQRKGHEDGIQELKEKIAKEDVLIKSHMVEFQELRAMNELLESKLLTAEGYEKTELEELRDEVAKLLEEKVHAVDEIEAVKALYEKTIKEHDEKILELQQAVDIRHDELQHAKEASVQSEKAQETKDQEKKAQDEETIALMLEENETLTSDLERYKHKAAKLEQKNGRMKKQMSKQDEAFAEQDREIQRLVSFLTAETEKAEKLAKDKKHWKDSAAKLAERVITLEQKREEMKKEIFDDIKRSKPSERERQLAIELAELRQEKEIQRAEAKKAEDMLGYVGLSAGLEVFGFNEQGKSGKRRADESILSACESLEQRRGPWNTKKESVVKLNSSRAERADSNVRRGWTRRPKNPARVHSSSCVQKDAKKFQAHQFCRSGWKLDFKEG